MVAHRFESLIGSGCSAPELAQFVVSLLESIVVADHRDVVVRCGDLSSYWYWFSFRLRDQLVVQLLLPFRFLIVNTRTVRAVAERWRPIQSRPERR